MEHQLANGQAAPSARHTTAVAPGGYEGAPVLAATPILAAAIRKRSGFRTPQEWGSRAGTGMSANHLNADIPKWVTRGRLVAMKRRSASIHVADKQQLLYGTWMPVGGAVHNKSRTKAAATIS